MFFSIFETLFLLKNHLLFQLIYGSMGWQTYSVVHPDAVQDICGKSVQLIEDLPKQLDGTAMASSGSNAIQLPKSACLGVLGTAEIFFRYIKL